MSGDVAEAQQAAGRPPVVGLTGGIAAGKSLVSARLAEQGAHIVDADRYGHRVIAPDGAAYDEVIRTFGREIVAPDGTIDRRKLGAMVFADPARLQQLNRISHPRMARLMAEDIDRLRSGAEGPVPPLIVLDAALLYEAGWDALCDAVWVVVAPPGAAMERLMARNGLTAEQARQRIDAQMDPQAKAARGDRVLVNDGTIEALVEKVDALWAETVGRAA